MFDFIHSSINYQQPLVIVECSTAPLFLSGVVIGDLYYQDERQWFTSRGKNHMIQGI